MKTQHPDTLAPFARLAEQLRQRIRSGTLQPGDRLPSWAELQRDYGVNNYTIDKAQKQLLAEGLIVARQGSGTFVSEPVAAQRTGIIGLCGAGFTEAGLSSSYWSRLLQGIREGADEYGLQILLLDLNSSANWEKADGILMSDQTVSEVRQRVAAAQPRVGLLKPLQQYPAVLADDRQGTKLATEYLLQLCHRRIDYLHGSPQGLAGVRLQGYLDAMTATNMRVSKTWMREFHGLPKYGEMFDYGDRFIETGYANMTNWLGKGWQKLGCTALLCHNDEIAIGALQAFREAEIDVPGEVSIIGFDGIEITAHTNPPLTTIEVPLREVGRAAVQLLMHQIAEDARGNEVQVLPVGLKVRASTAPPANKPNI
jgi:LacI family repressor for deo operon, udp, cdd, tsx, nupC, and nupG